MGQNHAQGPAMRVYPFLFYLSSFSFIFPFSSLFLFLPILKSQFELQICGENVQFEHTHVEGIYSYFYFISCRIVFSSFLILFPNF
jgi:hypothetical protein